MPQPGLAPPNQFDEHKASCRRVPTHWTGRICEERVCHSRFLSQQKQMLSPLLLQVAHSEGGYGTPEVIRTPDLLLHSNVVGP